MRTRKDLPRFGYIKNKMVNIVDIISHLHSNGMLNYNVYNDIKASYKTSHKDFVVLNSFSKNSFFKESESPDLEGENYVQLYLTDFDESKRKNDFNIENIETTIFTRMRRLMTETSSYIPEADELNYGVRNNYVKGVLSDVLDIFIGKVTRVRLACLRAGSEIKTHVDYDPSYICRYHIPLITNDQVKMFVERNKQVVDYHMPADGRIYFFNSGLKHSVINNSELDRLHLIVDVHGQHDLDDLETIIF